MNGLSKSCSQRTSWDTPSVISSPASGDGPTPCASPDGPTTDLFGQGLAPASPSRVRARRKVSPIPATSGPLGIGSSASVALTLLLANKLQAQPGSDGSILWRLTWKASTTPSGRWICRLRASRRPSSDSGCGSWPSPRAKESGDYCYSQGDHSRPNLTLSGAVKLASWPSPNAGPLNLGDTPWQARRAMLKAKHGNGNGFGMTLGMAATLATWAAPAARDGKHAGRTRKARTGGSQGEPPSQQIRLLVPGEMPTGSPAPTAHTGQLSPAHARWLMGLPSAWDLAAPTKTSRGRRC